MKPRPKLREASVGVNEKRILIGLLLLFFVLVAIRYWQVKSQAVTISVIRNGDEIKE